MKALKVYGQGKYRLEEVDIPQINEDEVLIRVEAVTVCHTDIQIADGLRTVCISFPIIPGHEFSGIVEKVGKLVRNVKPNDKVAVETIINCGICMNCRLGMTNKCGDLLELGSTTPGGFAQYAAVPEKMLHKLNSLSLLEAAFLEPAANAFNAVESANILPGDDVAVIGPGPIGLTAVQLVKLKHPNKIFVIGTNREDRLKLAGDFGADHVINITKTDPVKAIMELTSGKGVNRVIQCANTKASFEMSLNIVARHSIISIEGVCDINNPIELNVNCFVDKALSIIGVTGYSSEHFTKVLNLMDKKAIDIAPLITHKIPLAEVEKAFEMMRNKANGVLRIAILPNI